MLQEALTLFNKGNIQESILAYSEFIAAYPTHAPAICMLGMAKCQQRKFDEAEALFRRAIEINPNMIEAHINLGSTLQYSSRIDEAISAYQRVIQLSPDNSIVLYNLGSALQEKGNLEQAIQCYIDSLKLAPNNYHAFKNLGNAFKDTGRLEAALKSYESALALSADSVDTISNMGNVLRELRQLDKAIGCYEKALSINPDYFPAVVNMGNTYSDLGEFDTAIIHLKSALNLNPVSHEAHSNLIFIHNYVHDESPQNILDQAIVYGRIVAEEASPYRNWNVDLNLDKRLRLGFVSGDIRVHSVGFFLEGVLQALDRSRIEMYAYVTQSQEDDLTARVKPLFSNWTNCVGLSDKHMAHEIHQDGIDILIDLSGHTSLNRLPVFAFKPAPIQASWLGYLGTTGVAAMDYVIADGYAVPHEEECQFTETIWRLPEIYICNTPPGMDISVDQAPVIENGYVTFGCFNNLSKINQAVIACWAELLLRTPNSRLFLKARQLQDEKTRTGILQAFANHGVDAQQLHFEGWVASRQESLECYRRVDIALDPFPYPGITTTVEALWMGVPVLSLKGDRFISHQGETILRNAGLADWIAQDMDDYVAKGAGFGTDPAALAALRAGLRGQLLASPVCDAPRFARNFEAALRGMWRQWCDNAIGS